MKYKLYYIKDPTHKYFNEIRGIRFDHQYHHLPSCAEYIAKEFDSKKDGIPKMFFQEGGKDINFAKLKANADKTNIVEIKPAELNANPRYIEEKKSGQAKKLMEKQIKKNKRLEKISALEKIKIDKPELAEVAQKEIDKLNTEED